MCLEQVKQPSQNGLGSQEGGDEAQAEQAHHCSH